MIYDCFTFFNELDLLEIRFNILNDYVDKFVLVESTKTFTGKDKPLYYKENQERFSKFKDKIIHVVLDETPNEYAWYNECIQRNSISKGLINCNDDDIILISDLDEIPNPELINKYKDIEGIKLFEMTQHYYFLNCKAITQGVWLLGPKMLSYKDFKHYTDDKQEFIPYSEHLIKELNEGTTPSTIRYFRHLYHIKNGGWHFSCLGGANSVIQKFNSFSHTELNTKELNDAKALKKRIEKHKGFVALPVENYLPQYIVNNKEKYSDLICKTRRFELLNYKMHLFIRHIFSIYNEYSSWQKRKVIEILGIKIKFKRRQRL